MALTEDQKKSRERYNQALTKAKDGMYQESLQLLEEAVILDPTLAEPHTLIGKIYLQIGQTSKAKKSWQRALRLDPSSISARTCLDALEKNTFPWWQIAMIFIGVLVILLQVISFVSVAKKVSLQTKAITNELRQDMTRLRNDMNKKITSLNSVLTDIKKLTEEVKPAVVEVEKVDVEKKIVPPVKESAEDGYKKAVYLYMDGKYKEARRSLVMLPVNEIREDLRDNIIFWMGMCFHKEGRYNEALGQFQKLLELYPNGNKAPEAEKWKASCLEEMRKSSDHDR